LVQSLPTREPINRADIRNIITLAGCDSSWKIAFVLTKLRPDHVS
jgi:hypothetical protein